MPMDPLNVILWLHKHEVFQDWREVYRSSVSPFHVIITVWEKRWEFRTELNLVYERIFQTQKLSRNTICFLKAKREYLTGFLL